MLFDPSLSRRLDALEKRVQRLDRSESWQILPPLHHEFVGGVGRVLSLDPPAPTKVRIRNGQGVELDQYSIVGLGDPVIDPEQSERGWKNWTAFDSAFPTAAGSFAILQLPCPDGLTVPAVLNGVTQVLIDISDAAHDFAGPVDDNTTNLASSSAGAAQILKRDSMPAAALGATIHTGSGAPSDGDGFPDGDWYVDEDTDDYYGPKTEGAWGDAHVSGTGLVWAIVLLCCAGGGGEEDWIVYLPTGDLVNGTFYANVLPYDSGSFLTGDRCWVIDNNNAASLPAANRYITNRVRDVDGNGVSAVGGFYYVSLIDDNTDELTLGTSWEEWDGVISAWSAGSFVTGDKVTNAGSQWRANTSTSEEPGTGSDWDELSDAGNYVSTGSYDSWQYVQEFLPLFAINSLGETGASGSIATDPETDTAIGPDYTFIPTSHSGLTIAASTPGSPSEVAFNTAFSVGNPAGTYSSGFSIDWDSGSDTLRWNLRDWGGTFPSDPYAPDRGLMNGDDQFGAGEKWANKWGCLGGGGVSAYLDAASVVMEDPALGGYGGGKGTYSATALVYELDPDADVPTTGNVYAYSSAMAGIGLAMPGGMAGIGLAMPADTIDGLGGLGFALSPAMLGFGATHVAFLGTTDIDDDSNPILPAFGISANTVGPQTGLWGTIKYGGSASGGLVTDLGDDLVLADITDLASLAIDAAAITTGTLDDGLFPAMLPAVDGSQLTGIDSITSINGDTTAAQLISSGDSSITVDSASTPGATDLTVNFPGPADLSSGYSGTLPCSNGGLGLDGSAAAVGQILIGDGTGFTLQYMTSVDNSVSISTGSGTIDFSVTGATISWSGTSAYYSGTPVTIQEAVDRIAAVVSVSGASPIP